MFCWSPQTHSSPNRPVVLLHIRGTVDQIERAAPMAKFVAPREHHEDNARLIQLERERHGRILSSKQLRQYQRALRGVQSRIDSLLLDDVVSAKQELLSEWEKLRAQNERLREQMRVVEDELERSRIIEQLKIVRNNGLSVRDDILAANAKLRPHRRLLARRDALRSRIDEHIQTQEDFRLAERDRAAMAREANIFAELIIRTWNRLGYCYEVHKNGRTYRRSVRFERIVATPDEIQFKIDISQLGLLDSTRHNLPPGVKAYDLVKDETLLELSAATERQIVSPNNVGEARWRDGVWLRLYRLNYADGLPNRVLWSDVMKRYNPDRREAFPVPLGIRAGRHINWQGLADHPHWLIAGQTGSGKTNTLRMMLATWITSHPPQELRIFLIDLKRGGDLNPFAMAPHVVGEVITSVEDAEELMTRLVAYMRHCMDKISRVANKIEEYNRIVPESSRLPRVVVVFDEYAAIHSMGKELGKAIEAQVRILATQSRSAGIHLVLGTQQPYSTDVMDKQVRANVTIAATGKQRTSGAAIASLGTGEAANMMKIPGRMLVDDGSDTYQVQMPLIERADIFRVLAMCAKYERPTAFWPQSAESDSPAYSPNSDVLYQLFSKYGTAAIRAAEFWNQHVKSQMTRRAFFDMLSECVGSEFLADGVAYQLTTRTRGRNTEFYFQPVAAVASNKTPIVSSDFGNETATEDV